MGDSRALRTLFLDKGTFILFMDSRESRPDHSPDIEMSCAAALNATGRLSLTAQPPSSNVVETHILSENLCGTNPHFNFAVGGRGREVGK